MDRSFVNKCGHVTRRLNSHEPLTGKILETALDVIDASRKNFSDENFLDNLAKKFVSGQSLNDFECHIMVDMLLPYYRLS